MSEHHWWLSQLVVPSMARRSLVGQHSLHAGGHSQPRGAPPGSSTRTQQSPLQHKAHANQSLEAPKVMEPRAEEISNPLHLYLGHLLPLLVTVTISCSQGHVPIPA